MNKPQAITTLPESPEDERQRRMLRYAIAMGIRLVCVFLCFVVQGWWLVVPIIGAVVLPYVAVVIANASMRGAGDSVERPGFILPATPKDATDR